MTLYEFNALTKDEKAEVVWSRIFLGDRKAQNCKYLLYQLPNFYVELAYNPFENKIARFKSFTSTEPVDIYLHQRNLKDLLL